MTERHDFQEFISSLDNIAVWSGGKSGFDYMSPGFEDIWGRPVEDVLVDRSVVIQGTHPEDRNRVLAALEDREDRIANGETIEYSWRGNPFARPRTSLICVAERHLPGAGASTPATAPIPDLRDSATG